MRKSSRRSDQRMPAARHLAAAQVHALGARRVDEDLEARARQRQPGQLLRVELERQVGLARAVGVALEEVGAQHRPHDVEEAAQDAVLVEALDRVDLLLDRRAEPLGRARGRPPRGRSARAPGRPAAAPPAGGDERLLHVAVAERRAGLAQVAADRAQHGGLAPGQPGAQDQAVVAVALGVAAPGADEGVLEGVPDAVGLELVVAGVGQAEVVDPDALAVARRDRVGPLVGDLHAHVLEQRQQVGQRQRRAGAEHLRAQRALRAPRAAGRGAAPGRRARRAPRCGRCRPPPSAAPSRRGRRPGRPRRSGGTARAPRSSPCSSISASSRSSPHERVAATSSVSVWRSSSSGSSPGLDVGEVVQAHQHRLGDARGVVDAWSPRSPACRIPSMRRRFSVLKRSRGTNTRQRDEAVEGVAPHEQAHALALAQVQDPHADPEQVVARRSGTARRAGSSRGSRAAPSRCGCRAGTRRARSTASTLRRRIGISRGLAW